MEAIKDTFSNIMQSLEVKKKGSPEDDPQKWLRKTLTKKQLQHIKFNYFKEGVLGIAVDSSTWLYELNLHKGSLLAKLQTNNKQVKELRITLGRIR